MRLVRCLLLSGLAAVVAGGLTFSAAPALTVASGPAAHVAPHQPSARFIAEARRALVRYLRHHHPTIQFVHPGAGHSGTRGTSKVASLNWSGYADSATAHGTFTRVTGKWATPKVTCGREQQLTSEWVGLDGFTSQTVEQDGTFGWCFQGKPIYFTWFEMFPAGTVEVGRTLKPGDKITATVSRKGTAYTLSLKDATHPANGFTKKATCAATSCFNTSAEWTAERPAFANTGITPLANFGRWKVTGAGETHNGKSGTITSFKPNDAIAMRDSTNTYNLATVSSVSAGGTSFTATWHNSY